MGIRCRRAGSPAGRGRGGAPAPSPHPNPARPPGRPPGAPGRRPRRHSRRGRAGMRVYISVDIEGVAGIVDREQGNMAGGTEYALGRRLMTAETNAAIEGAFAGGATEVVVNDSHGGMKNLVPTELDPRAVLVHGRIKPWFMVEGLDGGFAACFLV